MSLNYDLSRCAISDPWDDEHKVLTDALIWGTMLTGIGTLTLEDLPEFMARLDVAGFWGNGYGATIEDVLPYVGLRTNVFPKETRAKWLKRVIGSELDRKVQHQYRVPA
jgi:hypothetical protein